MPSDRSFCSVFPAASIAAPGRASRHASPATRALAAGLAACLAGAAMAQTESPRLDLSPASGSPSAAPAPAAAFDADRAAAAQPRASVTLRGQHTFAADLGDVAGDVAVSRAAADLGIVFPVGDRSRLGFTLFSETSFYSFGDDTAFVSNEPWDNVQEIGLGASFRNQIDETWSYFVGAGVDASYEFGADFGDSVTFLGAGGAGYRVSPELNLGLGAIVSSRLEDDVFFIAFPTIDWRPSKDWRLSTGPGSGRSVELRLSYTASEQVTLGAFAALEARAFRLDDDGPVPGGVGRDWRLPVGLAATWSPSPRVSLSLEGGAFVYTELTLDDANGDEVREVEPDIAPFILAQVEFRF